MSGDLTARRTVVAIAPADPLAPTTFSGYSSHLFSGMQTRGVTIRPFASKDLRWYDVATGALNLRGFARGRFVGRSAPRIRPNWYWSRAGFERFSRRLAARLHDLPEDSVLLQVGTHVRAPAHTTDAYCVTDCTVLQALEGGEFAVSHVSARVAREAVECQGEVFASCRKVFTLSRWAADSVVQQYGIPSDRVVVVGAGANLGMRPERRHDTANPYVLFVGLDWEQKGGPLLLEAFRLLRASYPAIRLKIVGCAPPVEEPGVDVIGYLSPKQPESRRRLEALYGGASCFVLLSRFDCFPNVVLEAQLAGVPVVVLRGQGRAEAVRHGETGIVVDRPEPGLVANALETVLRDSFGQGRLGQAAERWAEQRFTWPQVVDHILVEMGVAV
jgi:glycosyltransferase involved in cell wall biosynthesis